MTERGARQQEEEKRVPLSLSSTAKGEENYQPHVSQTAEHDVHHCDAEQRESQNFMLMNTREFNNQLQTLETQFANRK